MTGTNPLDSLNRAYLPMASQPMGMPNLSAFNASSDMGIGLFNMPGMPSVDFGNIGGIFNQGNSLLQSASPFGTFQMPMQSTAPMSNFDWSAGLEQVLEKQKIFMENMKQQMTLAFNNALNTQKTTNNLTNNTDYGNNDFDVTKKYTHSAASLDKNLGGVLTGKGAKLIELQEKYGINAAFLAGLVNTESNYGRSNAAIKKNNVAGIMSKESNYMKLASFNSVDECLEALAKNLSKNYVGKGLKTISQIHTKYCPIGADNDPNGLNKNWGSAIASLTKKYEMA